MGSCMHEGHRHAQQNGISVIADGIETPQELAPVRRLEGEFVQECLIARPGVNPQRRFNVAGSQAA